MHADGYAGFNDLYRSGDVHEVACMAHKVFVLRLIEESAGLKAENAALREEIARLKGLWPKTGRHRPKAPPPGRSYQASG